jgi:Domain of unknown function (DUF4158)
MTKGSAAKLGFLIVLKTFQRLGYAVLVSDVPASIIRHIVVTLQLSTSSSELTGYDASGTRKRHLSAIRDYLHLQPYRATAQAITVAVMEKAALTKHDLVDLINIAIEELVRQRSELPAFSTLLRAAGKARTSVTHRFYCQITRSLTQLELDQIQTLFQLEDDTATTPWNELRQDPGKPTITHLQLLVKRLQWLAGLQVGTAALAAIPEVKRKHFADEALALDAARMKLLNRDKRNSLAVALLQAQYARTLDDMAEMLIR